MTHRLAVHHSSARDDWQTPPEVLRPALAVLGSVDLDPASDGANVPAARHFTKADDGLRCEWRGRVWLNPPYGRGGVTLRWVAKLVNEYEAGRTTEAIALLPGRPGSKWFEALGAFPLCFWSGRVRFIGAEDDAPFPSVLFYLGPRVEAFVETFSRHGRVYVPVTRPAAALQPTLLLEAA
jgi:phage N-6-adenine-methyltransferase